MNEWCHEFVDRNYRPQVDDLQCLFRPEAAESFSIEEAAGRVASASSVRTWTEVTTIGRGLGGS
jgi:ribulose 1,5-bisphosphate carboxylase large subunit-like protein